MMRAMTMADPNKLSDQLRGARREAEERDAQRRAKELDLPYIDLRPTPIQVDALGLIDEEVARASNVAAVQRSAKDVVFAALDPASDTAQEAVTSLEEKGYTVLPHVCSRGGLEVAWASYKFVQKKGGSITGQVSIRPERLSALKEEINTIEDVNEHLQEIGTSDTSATMEVILAGSLALGASDIHIEPAEKDARLRYRIDGELQDTSHFPLETHNAVTSRIKLLSHLKLNISDEPQDGRFTIKTSDKNIEVRTSTIPSEYGEVLVLRVLDPDAIKGELTALGLRAEDLEIVRTALKKPNGMILNTGPTGSGKTTTLYAFIRFVHSDEIKIITIEDPIEYHIAGISQTQVDQKSNYTFASGLRSILRQDPDVILVGEIRDLDTAETAMNAALTGHQVFSTLHTSEAAGAIPRLIDMGAKPQIIGPSLNLIIAQRLVRRLCEHCKTPAPLTDAQKEKLGVFIENLPARISKPDLSNVSVFAHSEEGCEKCHKGYKGRLGIFELLDVTDKIKELMHQEASSIAMREAAQENGMILMQEDGVLKILAGETDIAEIERVTGPIAALQ